MSNTIAHKEKKHARTKLALLDAVLALIREKSLDEIPVIDICEAAGVSRATFFNYFSSKNDLLIYFIQLWTVEVAYQARLASAAVGGLCAIEEIFRHTARLCREHPEIMAESIAFQARRKEDPRPDTVPLLTEAEKSLRFPHIKDFTGLEQGGLQSIFPPALMNAVRLGELPADLDIQATTFALAVIFFGVPATLGPARAEMYAELYIQQLKLLWTGIKNQAGGQ